MLKIETGKDIHIFHLFDATLVSGRISAYLVDTPNTGSLSTKDKICDNYIDGIITSRALTDHYISSVNLTFYVTEYVL